MSILIKFDVLSTRNYEKCYLIATPVFLQLSRFLSHRFDLSIHFRAETNMSGMYVSDYAATRYARGTMLDTSVKSIVITVFVKYVRFKKC